MPEYRLEWQKKNSNLITRVGTATLSRLFFIFSIDTPYYSIVLLRKEVFLIMSGHSHWSSIKHKKGATDLKRGKIFSKISRLISIASKEKGGDPESNPRLRVAIDKAKEANMPKDKIERAIKKGTGQLDGVKMEEIFYEAYGPAGIAIIIEGITDNKNRALAEIKHIISRFEGKLAETGSVQYLFDRKGEEWIPKYPIEITDEKTKNQLEKLFDALDENDDVQEIYSNLK